MFWSSGGPRGQEDCFSDQVINEIGDEKYFGGQLILKRGDRKCSSDPVFTTRSNGSSLRLDCRKRGGEKILAAPSLGKESMNKFIVTVDRKTGHNGFF